MRSGTRTLILSNYVDFPVVILAGACARAPGSGNGLLNDQLLQRKWEGRELHTEAFSLVLVLALSSNLRLKLCPHLIKKLCQAVVGHLVLRQHAAVRVVHGH